MPSIIFCYRILFGLQRKVSPGGGEKHFDERPRPPFTPRAPPCSRPASGGDLAAWAPRSRRAPRSRPRPGSPTHRCASNFPPACWGEDGRSGGDRARRGHERGPQVQREGSLKRTALPGVGPRTVPPTHTGFGKSEQVDEVGKFPRLGTGVSHRVCLASAISHFG